MDQLYGMFKGPQTDGMPGVLTLAGVHTRLTLWCQDQPLAGYYPKQVFGQLNNTRKMTLWGLHDATPVPDNLLHPWRGNGVEAVTAEPMYGVEGPCDFDLDDTPVAAITFRSPHLELDHDGSDLSSAVSKETVHGTLTVSADTDDQSPPITKVRLDFPEPVPFNPEGQRRIEVLLFLCEALTGRSHNADRAEFEVPLAEFPYRLHDFHTAGAPVFPRYRELPPFPHVAPVEFLDIGARWLDLFLDQDSTYPEIFSYLSASLNMHIRYDRLRVFQSVNVFDLCPTEQVGNKPLRLQDRIKDRIEIVAAEIEKLGLPPELPFTADNLRKFTTWGADLRNRVAHGPVDTRGKDPKPRPAYCDDPFAWGYVCNTLEFVLALSTLIECGLDFRQWFERSQPWRRNKFRDVTSPCQFEKMVSHMEVLASPAVTSSAGKTGF